MKKKHRKSEYLQILFFKNGKLEDAWVAQSVKHPTLDFSSGHDLGVVRLSLMLGSLPGMEPA